MKKYLIIALGLLFLVVGCTSNKVEEHATKTSTTKSSTFYDESVESSSVSEKIDPEKIKTTVVYALNEGFGSFFNVEYNPDRRIYEMTPIEGKPETATLTKIAENPNFEGHEDALKNSASSLFEFTNMAKTQTGESIVVSIMNPVDPKSDLVSVSDGKIIYSIYK